MVRAGLRTSTPTPRHRCSRRRGPEDSVKHAYSTYIPASPVLACSQIGRRDGAGARQPQSQWRQGGGGEGSGCLASKQETSMQWRGVGCGSQRWGGGLQGHKTVLVGNIHTVLSLVWWCRGRALCNHLT